MPDSPKQTLIRKIQHIGFRRRVPAIELSGVVKANGEEYL